MELKQETFKMPDGSTATITHGSGNVFADLGLPDAEECFLKAQLAFQIRTLIKNRKLTQTAAAKIAGVSQPKISQILGGHLDGYSAERLLTIINNLGYDVEVRINPKKKRAPATGHISVVAG